MADLIITPVNQSIDPAAGEIILNYRIDDFTDAAVSSIAFDIYFSDELTIDANSIVVPSSVGTVPFIGGRLASADTGNGDGDAATTNFIRITLSPLNTATTDTLFITIPFTTTGEFDGSDSVNFITTSANPTVETPQPPSVTIGEDQVVLPSVTLSLSDTSFDENGGTTTVTATLSAATTQDVVVELAFDGAASGTDFDPSADQITIPAGETSGSLTLTGLDNSEVSGERAFSVAIATITGAVESGNQEVTVTITDDDVANIRVTPTNGLNTTEAGGTATFTVVLDSPPTANVTIPLSVSDPTEGSLDQTSLSFNAANFNIPQTVTITGVDDAIADGDVAYVIQTGAATSADPNFNGLNPANVQVTNTDNDVAGITVTPTSGLTTTEAGGSATFTVVLNTEPTADVTIALSSSDPGEGIVSAATLTFTVANFNTPQTVTLTGVDDAIADGDVAYTVITEAAQSSDPAYSGLNPADVAAINTDDEPSPGFTITPTNGLTTTESGGTATFTVVLDTQPTANVTLTLGSSDVTEGTVAPLTLTFTPGNFATPQTVTVTGEDDTLLDGDQSYTIITNGATSTDPDYNGLNPVDVTVTNLDDEEIGVVDGNGNPIEGAIALTTPLSEFRPGAEDSELIRPNNPGTTLPLFLSNSAVAEGITLEEIQLENTDSISVEPSLTNNPADDLVIPVGSSEEFQLTYSPEDAGENLADLGATLTLVTNVQDLTFPLSGQSTFNGDISYDGTVDSGDLDVLSTNFGTTTSSSNFDPTADINGDGRINLTDLGLLNAQFGLSLS